MARVLVVGLLAILAQAGAAQSPPRWQLKEELRIGSLDDEATAFGWIADIKPDARGNIYVMDARIPALRVFDPSGLPLRTIGKRGTGPGEFQGPFFWGFLADTLYTSDVLSKRVSYFSLDGRFLGSTVIAKLDVKFPLSRGVPSLLLPNGTGYLHPGYAVRPDVRRIRYPRLLVDRNGRTLDTVSVTDFRLRPPEAIGDFYFNSPVVPMATGTHAFILDRPEATSGRAAQFVVHKVTLRGDTIWTRPYSYRPRLVERVVIDSLITAKAKRAGVPEAEIRKTAVHPKFWPAFGDAVGTADGGLWLPMNEGPRTTNRWQVIDAEGRVQAMLDLPVTVLPIYIAGNTVYAAVRDELDVPYAVRYRIVK